jgi:hypothetical protein
LSVIVAAALPAFVAGAPSVAADTDAGRPDSGEAGTGSGSGAGSESDAAPTVSAQDYAGVWAQKRIQTAVVDFPVLGRSAVTTTTVLRLRMTASGRDLAVAVEACSIQQDTGLSIISVMFPEELVKRAGRFDANGSLRWEEGELRYFQPRRWLIFGARLADVEEDALPADATDERVLDQDGDGKPGVTVQVRGLVNADLYLVQRGWTTLRGVATGGNRIDGRIQWGEDHVVLGSNSALLTSLPGSVPDPEPDASSFRTTRIDESTDCAAIVADQEHLFAR